MRRNVLLLVMIALTIFWGYEKFSSDDQTSSDVRTPSSTTPQSNTASMLHAEGLKFYNEGKYAEAIDAWKKEAELVPRNANTVNNIGIAYSGLGDYDSAIEYHKKAIELDPNFGHAYHSLALVYANLKDYQQAKVNYKKAIELKYANGDSYYGLGYAAMQLKEYDDAVEAFKKARETSPSYVFVSAMMGDCYRALGKSDLARKEYEQTIARNPSELNARTGILRMDVLADPINADLWFKLGIELKMHSKEEEFNEAINAFKKVIEINPAYPEAHYELGQLYEKSLSGSDLFAAKDEYSIEMKNDPDSEKVKIALEQIADKINNQPESRETDISLFESITFPQKAVVVRDNAEIYDSSFSSLLGVSKGLEVTIAGVYHRTVKLKEDHFLQDQVYYIVSSTFNGSMDMNIMGLVNTKDVILKRDMNNAWYKFLKTGASIIKSPIGRINEQGRLVNKYFLWLKVEDKFKFLGDYKENWVCNEDLAISTSPDGKYAFIIGASVVLSVDGSTIQRISNENFSFQIWDGDLLFLRHADYDDSIYFMKPKTGEYGLLISLRQEGGIYHRNGPDGCIMKPAPIELEDGLVKVIFQRKDQNPPEPHKNCKTVTVLATNGGKIVKEDNRWDYCD